jgi:hypothetical protein
MFIGKMMHNGITERVNKLENNSATKDTLADMKKSMEEHRAETRSNFNTVQATLNTILLKVGGNDRD